MNRKHLKVKMKDNVCAVVVTYNAGGDFLVCFNAIKGQTDEVVIIDNGSDKETTVLLNELERTRSCVKVFYNAENLGIGAALNMGVKYAIERGYEWILTLDHDSEAAPGMVEELLNAYEALTGEGICNIGIVAANSFDRNIQKYLREELFKGVREVEEVETSISAGSLINTCVFEKVGFFNESLFLYYVDDDFCLKCKNEGWRIYVCRKAVLFHREGVKEIKTFLGGKFICRNYDFHARYYMSRNAVYMLKNYFKYREYWFRTIKRICSDFVKVVLFDKDKIKLLCFMIKGTFDGIAGRYGKLVISGDKS